MDVDAYVRPYLATDTDVRLQFTVHGNADVRLLHSRTTIRITDNIMLNRTSSEKVFPSKQIQIAT